MHAQSLMKFAEKPHCPRGWEDDLDRHCAFGRDVHVKVLFGEANIVQRA
jgi:hypothetical protein